MHDVLQSALEFMRSLMYQNKVLGGTGEGCVEVHSNTEVDGRQCSMTVDLIALASTFLVIKMSWV